MSRLDELIAELCPGGVKYRVLNTCCKIYDGTHSTPKYTESGVKFVSVKDINDLYGTTSYISEEDFAKYKIKPQIDDILMTRIGSIGVCAVVDRDEPLAFYVSLALLRPDKKLFLSKFLKYAIESIQGRKELRKRTLVNAVPIKINKDDIGKIKIPVPPLEVQREIVRILDNFTELTAELTAELIAELTARKQQYEYYRGILLNDTNSQTMTLKQISNNVFSGKNKKRLDDGEFPVYGSTGIISTTDAAVYHKTQILIARVGANAGYVHIADGDYDVSDNTLIVDLKDDVNLRYIYYQLDAMNLNQYAKGGGQPLVTAGQMKEINIPMPSIERQNQIVEILDRFYRICTDISSGLPAEIDARQKQYEYYRDKLLTFKQLA